MYRFTLAYLKSMRLYYAFVTGVAGWLGVAYYDFIQPGRLGHARAALLVTLLFLTWGINQVVNDYLGLPEDRVNAPHRPMVTGELNPRGALALSLGLMALVGILSWFLNPWSAAAVAVGVGLNILYESAKAWGLWGNAVFGAMIAMCAVYGFLAAGPLPSPAFTAERLGALAVVAALNALMTYYTYFKDAAGDAAAGKRTFIVRAGLSAAKWTGLAGAFLPAAMMLGFYAAGWLPRASAAQPQFLLCAAAALALQLWTAVLYIRHPEGARTYYNLKTNFRACVAGQAALIAAFNAPLGLGLLAASYVLIGVLFDLHGDHQA